MVELAQRVPERSPPLNSTSTASALAMFRTLSVSALISSREYICRGIIAAYESGFGFGEDVPAGRVRQIGQVRLERGRLRVVVHAGHANPFARVSEGSARHEPRIGRRGLGRLL